MFLKKKTKTKDRDLGSYKKKLPFYRRRSWKIFFILLAIVLVSLCAFIYYLMNTGSKIFENGISASSIIKTISGAKETLKGEGEDRINVLLMGMGGPNHPGGLLTDSVMVASIEPKEKKIALLSIPRDLNVDASGNGSVKINSVFATGYNNYMSRECKDKNKNNCQKDAMTAGANASVGIVSNITGLNIPYYFTIQFKGFESIIDQLGGIDVVVDKAINDPLFPSEDMIHYSPFKISAGPHHMDGQAALNFARSRETSSDFDRAARQQKIILAIKDKAEKINLLTDSKKALNIFSSLSDSFYTNFSPGEIKSFLEITKGLDTGNPINKVLTDAADGQLMGSDKGVYLLQPKTGNFNEIRGIAKNIFSTKLSANIEIYNGAKLTTSQIASVRSRLEKNVDFDLNVVSTVAYGNLTAKTIVYDYTSGTKANILSYLKKEFNTDSIQKTRPINNRADFEIVVGQNYLKK